MRSSCESWKAVSGFDGLYEVSSHGRVRSVTKMQRYVLRSGVPALRRVPGRTLATQLNNSGYVIVHLYKNNVRHVKTVHRLVALAFLEKTAPEINHKDGVKVNNQTSNLEWCTRSFNLRHAHATGLK